MKKYLVTGGAGFIGSNYIHYLFEKYSDIQVINLDKLTYAGNLENLREIENRPDYQFVEGDICDRELLRQLLPGVEVIFHQAALPCVWPPVGTGRQIRPISNGIAQVAMLPHQAAQYKTEVTYWPNPVIDSFISSLCGKCATERSHCKMQSEKCKLAIFQRYCHRNLYCRDD